MCVQSQWERRDGEMKREGGEEKDRALPGPWTDS